MSMTTTAITPFIGGSGTGPRLGWDADRQRVMNEGGQSERQVRAFGVMAGGVLEGTLGVLWFGSCPLAGLSVAVCGAAMLRWGRTGWFSIGECGLTRTSEIGRPDGGGGCSTRPPSARAWT